MINPALDHFKSYFNLDDALRQKGWNNYLLYSHSFVDRWISFFRSDYVLFEIDDNKKQIKMHERHRNIILNNILSQQKINIKLSFPISHKYNDVF